MSEQKTEQWRGLFDAIKHGDDGHQAWLKAAIEAYFTGQPMPEVVMSAPSPSLQIATRKAALCDEAAPLLAALAQSSPRTPHLDIADWCKRYEAEVKA